MSHTNDWLWLGAEVKMAIGEEKVFVDLESLAILYVEVITFFELS